MGHLQRQAKYGALLMRHFMDGDTATQLMFNLVGGEIRRWPPVVDHELQELLRQFELPEHAADLSLLERYIIPTINADATATARSIIERLKRREGEDIKPKRRSVKVDPKLRVGEIVQGYDGKVMVVTGWERCDGESSAPSSAESTVLTGLRRRILLGDSLHLLRCALGVDLLGASLLTAWSITDRAAVRCRLSLRRSNHLQRGLLRIRHAANRGGDSRVPDECALPRSLLQDKGNDVRR